MKYVLIILLIGNADGGRAAMTVPFKDKAACEHAAEQVAEATKRYRSGSIIAPWPPILACVGGAE